MCHSDIQIVNCIWTNIFYLLLESQLFFPIWINSNILDLRNLQEQVKKYSVSKIVLTFLSPILAMFTLHFLYQNASTSRILEPSPQVLISSIPYFSTSDFCHLLLDPIFQVTFRSHEGFSFLRHFAEVFSCNLREIWKP